jgi:hypothetical protein
MDRTTFWPERPFQMMVGIPIASFLGKINAPRVATMEFLQAAIVATRLLCLSVWELFHWAGADHSLQRPVS